MSEIHETIEKAQEGEHSQYFNRRIALLIAVLALFLSFSETLGKSAQTQAVDANVKSSDTWAFFQAKDIRRTTLNTAADQTALLAANMTDPAVKAAIDKQIEVWRATAARYESDPKTGEARRAANADRGGGRLRPGRESLNAESDRRLEKDRGAL